MSGGALWAAPGKPLTDTNGVQLKIGQTVTDDVFGDGIVRGTVPLDKGEGLNVLINWLGPRDNSKPKSRGGANLTVKFVATGVSTFHTGADFESGAVHAARGRNDRSAYTATAVRQRRSPDIYCHCSDRPR